MIAGSIIYSLCALTSLLCTVLLARAYRRTRAPLLFWSAVCFAALACNNALLFVDIVVLPQTDLSLERIGTALIAVCALGYGIIAEVK
jgi:hypothetical protein